LPAPITVIFMGGLLRDSCEGGRAEPGNSEACTVVRTRPEQASTTLMRLFAGVPSYAPGMMLTTFFALLYLRKWTTPLILANRVSSPPMPTLTPG